MIVRFAAHVSALDGQESARALVAEVGDRPFSLHLDLGRTRGYESGARLAWQDALWPRRSQVRELVVVTFSPVPRMGVSMLAAFLGIPCRHVESLEG